MYVGYLCISNLKTTSCHVLECCARIKNKTEIAKYKQKMSLETERIFELQCIFIRDCLLFVIYICIIYKISLEILYSFQVICNTVGYCTSKKHQLRYRPLQVTSETRKNKRMTKAANILNKQSRTADKGWSSRLGGW
jgi:hypothetical protein